MRVVWDEGGRVVVGGVRRGVADGDFDRFKSTPVHSTAFKARRLPRAYLILLESLLNPSPSGRPSCEKVVSAVRMGQVLPISLHACSQC